MAYEEVKCPKCGSSVHRHGKGKCNQRRYKCLNKECRKTFQVQYKYNACYPGTKEQIEKHAINGTGVRDTSRIMNIAIDTVISCLKKNKNEVS